MLPQTNIVLRVSNSSHARTHTHTHTHTFNGPFSGTTRVSWYQKGKTNLDLTEARDSEWQWHQLGHTQVCTLLQTDNHASTPSLGFFSVRPSTPFSADTDTPIFCCQSNTIPIRYRFFDTLQERTWRHVTDRSKDPDATAATNNSGAPRTCCSAVVDAFDLSWTVKHSNYQ